MAEPSTTFVLGAGFSAEQQFPLVWGLKERVIHFLEAEQHARYKTFLSDSQGLGYAQFYEGLTRVDPNNALGFEEVLIALAGYLTAADREDPAFVTDEVLRIGCARLLWCIDGFIWQVAQCYEYFARRLVQHSWRVMSFNWDVLVERSIHEVNGSWTYSLAGNGVPVIKPHGSINWSAHAQHENLTPEYQYWQPIAPASKLSFDIKRPLANPDMQAINEDLRYCLYPGDPDLPSTNADLQLLWTDAESAITQSKRVVFIGYSLPPYDSFGGKFLIKLCANTAVDVYDPSLATRQRFKQALPHANCYDLKFNGTPYAQRLP